MNDLKIGTLFIYKGQPHEVLEASHLKVAQRRPVMQTKIKNLITGNVLYQNFQQSDKFEEADISREKCAFIYTHRDQYWFTKKEKPSERFHLIKEQIGDNVQFLKPNADVEVSFFEEKPIKLTLPIKLDLKVAEAPPSIKGDTAKGGTKTVVLETGAKVQTPLFIEVGDIIRVNTQTGEYTERVEKA